MKKNAILLSLLLIGSLTYGQQKNLDKPSDKEVKTFAEKMPEYPGGEDELLKYLVANIKYPTKAIENEIEGIVNAEFVVCEDGSICELKFVDNSDTILQNASYNVIANMPNWNPGMIDNKPVRVRYMIPLTFKLTDSVEDKKTKKQRRKENRNR